MDAFDSDALIYAAIPDHPLGRRVAALLPAGNARVGVGSVLLLPEVLSKPVREGAQDEAQALGELLSRLELFPVDRPTAELATSLAATYRLRGADAAHLATAVAAGADRFVTNNHRDFPKDIVEIDVTYPADLPG